MKKPSLEKIDTAIPAEGECEILEIHYTLDNLEIIVLNRSNNKKYAVSFGLTKGFKVLDESNLLEYWDEIPKNGLYKVYKDGWLTFESTRKGFFADGFGKTQEYFISGADDCIHIFSQSPPTVKEL